VRQRFHGHKIARASRRTENTNALESAMGRAARVRREKDPATHRVAGKESHVESAVDRGLQVVEHFDGVILVVTDGQKTLRPQQSLWLCVRVEVRDVSDIITARFQPVSERKFPEEPFAGTGGKRRIEDLAILSV